MTTQHLIHKCVLLQRDTSSCDTKTQSSFENNRNFGIRQRSGDVCKRECS